MEDNQVISEIDKFINHFHSVSRRDELSEVFTCGCCYWFAYILCGRFSEAKLMYDPVVNHFVAMYGNRLYDITGDVTGKYAPINWSDFDDELERENIIKHCIDFK